MGGENGRLIASAVRLCWKEKKDTSLVTAKVENNNNNSRNSRSREREVCERVCVRACVRACVRVYLYSSLGKM